MSNKLLNDEMNRLRTQLAQSQSSLSFFNPQVSSVCVHACKNECVHECVAEKGREKEREVEYCRSGGKEGGRVVSRNPHWSVALYAYCSESAHLFVVREGGAVVCVSIRVGTEDFEQEGGVRRWPEKRGRRHPPSGPRTPRVGHRQGTRATPKGVLSRKAQKGSPPLPSGKAETPFAIFCPEFLIQNLCFRSTYRANAGQKGGPQKTSAAPLGSTATENERKGLFGLW